MHSLFRIVAGSSLLWLAAVSAEAAVEYSVTYMGNFEPQAINNEGAVVGMIAYDNYVYHAALWQNGVLKDLGTLGGTYAYAAGINDSGQIVGVSEIANGPMHAFLYENGQMNDLGTFGGVSSDAEGINNYGQIAANYDTPDGGTHAILYDHGAITELGNVGGNVTVAKVINSSGVIAGQGTTSQGDLQPFVYQNGKITDLGIPCAYGHAFGINDTGQIVGDWSNANTPLRAFLYENGGIADIASFSNGTTANCINNSGDIVGSGLISGKAFIYSNGTFSNLNDLIDQTGTTLGSAYGINDPGQIVAGGYSDEYGYGAYLLTPVPEPVTLMLLCSALVCVLPFATRGHRRRRNYSMQGHEKGHEKGGHEKGTLLILTDWARNDKGCLCPEPLDPLKEG